MGSRIQSSLVNLQALVDCCFAASFLPTHILPKIILKMFKIASAWEKPLFDESLHQMYV